MKIQIYVLLLLFLLMPIFSQTTVKKRGSLEIGTELEIYPVGYMPTLTANFFIKKDFALRFRIGANFADRQDFSGLNDDEVAEGYGGSVGIVKYFPKWNGNIIVGFTTDFWKMKTYWRDNNLTGTTTNLVVQPWINGGYLYNISKKINTGLSIGFGREINTFNKGQEVGGGWMGITTISLNIKLR
jgi:hypothetical protein